MLDLSQSNNPDAFLNHSNSFIKPNIVHRVELLNVEAQTMMTKLLLSVPIASMTVVKSALS